MFGAFDKLTAFFRHGGGLLNLRRKLRPRDTEAEISAARACRYYNHYPALTEGGGAVSKV